MEKNLLKLLCVSFLFTVSCGSGDSEDTVNPSVTILSRLFFTDTMPDSGDKGLHEFNPETESTRLIGGGFYDELSTDYDQESPVLVSHQGVVYFSASTAATGFELWQYDPREEEVSGVNPKMVADLVPGTDDSYPYAFRSFGEYLYFQADSENNGKELYIYDPREEVSLTNPLLVDLSAGSADSRPQHLVIYRDKIYFNAQDAATGREPWVFDPSQAISSGVNPRVLFDINPGASSSFAYDFTVHNNKLYFSATSTNGNELWVYDADQPESSSNPSEVIDLNPGSASSNTNLMFSIGNKLYFVADEAATGEEFWSYDPSLPTSPTNPQVHDFISGTAESDPKYGVSVGSKLYYTAENDLGENEFYIWDTALAESTGTNPLMVDLDLTSTEGSYPWQYTACVDQKVCFAAESLATGNYTLRVLDTTLSSVTGDNVFEFNDHLGTDATDFMNYSEEIIE